MSGFASYLKKKDDGPKKKKGLHPFGHDSIDQKGGPCEKCMQMAQATMKKNEMEYGKDHPLTLAGICHNAAMFKTMGDHATSKTLYEKALPLYEKRFGISAPETENIKKFLGISDAM